MQNEWTREFASSGSGLGCKIIRPARAGWMAQSLKDGLGRESGALKLYKLDCAGAEFQVQRARAVVNLA